MSDGKEKDSAEVKKSKTEYGVVVTLRIQRADLDRLDNACKAAGRTRAAYIRKAIEKELAGEQSVEMSPREYMDSVRVLGELAVALKGLPEGDAVGELEGRLESFRSRLDAVRLGSDEGSG